MRSINLTGAKLIIEYFTDEAKALDTTGEIIIVDRFANAIAYARLDDYQEANYAEALRLAKLAAAFAMPTEKLAEETGPGQRFGHLRESINGSFESGGYPITFEGEVIGAIGIIINSTSLNHTLATALLGKLSENRLLVL